MGDESVFNPLAKRNLGKSVVEALLDQPAQSLRDIEVFPGAGVYSIYYCGDFPSYKALSDLNRQDVGFPIYVGKAIPKGGRKGTSIDASLDSTALANRLQQRKASIDAVASLKTEDFSYRSLVVDDIWISLGETLIIQRFQPLWNQVVDGFGNHDPGKGRYGGMRPSWGEFHPGRSWAERCQPAKNSHERILGAIETYMANLKNREGILPTEHTNSLAYLRWRTRSTQRARWPRIALSRAEAASLASLSCETLAHHAVAQRSMVTAR